MNATKSARFHHAIKAALSVVLALSLSIFSFQPVAFADDALVGAAAEPESTPSEPEAGSDEGSTPEASADDSPAPSVLAQSTKDASDENASAPNDEQAEDDQPAEEEEEEEEEKEEPVAPTLNGVRIQHEQSDTQSIRIGQSVDVSPILTGQISDKVSFNYVWSYNGSWKTGDWSSTVNKTGAPTSDATFEFKPAKSGTYIIYIDLYWEGKSVKTVEKKLTVKEEWSFGGITLSSKTIQLGQQLTITADITGPDSAAAQLNYGWSYEGSWKDGDWWSLAKGGTYTNKGTYTFDLNKAGTYLIFADAVTSTGKKTTYSANVTVESTWELEGLETSATKITYGEPLDLELVLKNGSNPNYLQYNFGWQYGTGWSKWDSLLKNGKTTDSPSYTMTLPEHGTYRVFGDVIGTEGTKATASTQVEVVLPFEYEGVDASDSSILLGDSVTITPQLSGDASTARYNYAWSRNGKWGKGEWSSTLNDTGGYTSDATWEFKPKDDGTYTIYVDVLAPDGTVKTLSTKVVVDRGWTCAGIATSLASPQLKHKKIDFAPSISGERVDELEFNYVWTNSNWSSWDSTVKSTGKRTKDGEGSSFTPTKSGNYTLYIDVYDPASGKTVTYSKAFKITKAWDLTKLTLSYSSPLRPSAKVTFKPEITGNTKGLQYNYVWQCNNWSSWSSDVKQTGKYVTSSSVSYRIGSANGTYSFYVDVVDTDGEKETAQVTGIPGYSASYAKNSVINVAKKEIGPSSGTKYENALKKAGGKLCNNRHGWWCANFVWWCFRQAGQQRLWCNGSLEVDPEYAANSFKRSGRYYSSMLGVKVGDIAFSYWTPWRSGQNITHAAIVVGVSGSSITVIEGNMGDGVGKHTYSKSDYHWRGYARPAY